MLVVDCYIENTKGKGVGLFAKQLIPMNAKYWVRDTNFDRTFSKAEAESMPPFALDFLSTYGFLEKNGNWYLCVDNARFTNHSDYPNTENIFNLDGDLVYCIATRDIQPGEEIVCNYKDICETCIQQLGFEDIENLHIV